MVNYGPISHPYCNLKAMARHQYVQSLIRRNVSVILKLIFTDEELMGYFRAILVKGEVSVRAYELCAEVLTHNPGDYHAW
jgi:hypothetical protein